MAENTPQDFPIVGGLAIYQDSVEGKLLIGTYSDKKGKFLLELDRDSLPNARYFLQVKSVSYMDAYYMWEKKPLEVPINLQKSSTLAIRLAEETDKQSYLGIVVYQPIPFHKRFFRNLTRPLGRIRNYLNF